MDNKRFPFPYVLTSRILRQNVSDDIKDVCSRYAELFSHATQLEGELLVERAKTQRLTHENEFMLRLIDKRENNETN